MNRKKSSTAGVQFLVMNRVNQRLSTAKSKESVAIAYYQFATPGAKNCGINSESMETLKTRPKLHQNVMKNRALYNANFTIIFKINIVNFLNYFMLS